MKKYFYLFLITLSNISLSNNTLVAQRPLNNINVNILGNAPIVSMNYERIFPMNQFFMIATQLGLGYIPSYNKLKLTYLTVPYNITGNLGKGVYFFEFGIIGAGFYKYKEAFNLISLSPMIGYRYQPVKRRTANFRIYVMNYNRPWIGLSLGALF